MNKRYFFSLVTALLLTCFSVAATPTEYANKASITYLSDKERDLFCFLEQEIEKGTSIKEIMDQCVKEGYISAQELTILEKVVNHAKSDEQVALANRKILWVLGGIAVGSIVICIGILWLLKDFKVR